MRTERLRRLARRGSVLLHVMLTSILVATIAASILRMAMLRYSMGQRSALILQEKRVDQGGLAMVIQAWSSVGRTCANNVPNYACGAPNSSPTPGDCGCTCNPTVALTPPLPQIKTSGTPGNCKLDIGASTDLQ